MNDWTTIIDAGAALLNLTAAIIALITARSQRPGKQLADRGLGPEASGPRSVNTATDEYCTCAG